MTRRLMLILILLFLVVCLALPQGISADDPPVIEQLKPLLYHSAFVVLGEEYDGKQQVLVSASTSPTTAVQLDVVRQFTSTQELVTLTFGNEFYRLIPMEGGDEDISIHLRETQTVYNLPYFSVAWSKRNCFPGPQISYLRVRGFTVFQMRNTTERPLYLLDSLQWLETKPGEFFSWVGHEQASLRFQVQKESGIEHLCASVGYTFPYIRGIPKIESVEIIRDTQQWLLRIHGEGLRRDSNTSFLWFYPNGGDRGYQIARSDQLGQPNIWQEGEIQLHILAQEPFVGKFLVIVGNDVAESETGIWPVEQYFLPIMGRRSSWSVQ